MDEGCTGIVLLCMHQCFRHMNTIQPHTYVHTHTPIPHLSAHPLTHTPPDCILTPTPHLSAHLHTPLVWTPHLSAHPPTVPSTCLGQAPLVLGPSKVHRPDLVSFTVFTHVYTHSSLLPSLLKPTSRLARTIHRPVALPALCPPLAHP